MSFLKTRTYICFYIIRQGLNGRISEEQKNAVLKYLPAMCGKEVYKLEQKRHNLKNVVDNIKSLKLYSPTVLNGLVMNKIGGQQT